MKLPDLKEVVEDPEARYDWGAMIQRAQRKFAKKELYPYLPNLKKAKRIFSRFSQDRRIIRTCIKNQGNPIKLQSVRLLIKNYLITTSQITCGIDRIFNFIDWVSPYIHQAVKEGENALSAVEDKTEIGWLEARRIYNKGLLLIRILDDPFSHVVYVYDYTALFYGSPDYYVDFDVLDVVDGVSDFPLALEKFLEYQTPTKNKEYMRRSVVKLLFRESYALNETVLPVAEHRMMSHFDFTL